MSEEDESLAERIARLPLRERAAYVRTLPRDVALRALFTWRHWARPKQLVPLAAFYVWLILAGRGFGKTRTGAETVRGWVEQHPVGARPLQILLVGETAADARDVMVEGPAGILAVSPPWLYPHYEPAKRTITWTRKGRVVAIAKLRSGAEPDGTRGLNSDKAWIDEFAKYKYPEETWDNIALGLRLGLNPQAIMTTTPRPIKILRELIASRDTITTRGSTYENVANLAPVFFRRVREKYEGTRLGRQELHADLLDDIPGALWTRALLDHDRLRPDRHGKLMLPEMDRIIVSVDPSGSSHEDSDEAGIIVAGRAVTGDAYVWDDLSAIMSPLEWGRMTVNEYHNNEGDLIIGETNYGGDMVETVIHGIDPNVPFKKITASRGKHVRAEPVSSIYEQHRVHHVGNLARMEDELVQFTQKGYMGGASPNRADANIFALTELLIEEGLDDGTPWDTITE